MWRRLLLTAEVLLLPVSMRCKPFKLFKPFKFFKPFKLFERLFVRTKSLRLTLLLVLD